uniref:TFIIS N-terminal domain-containing protein n=1 Tax=Oryza meridionalis TaxID=40149 RepID=A0A0E0EWA3_9ORYZ
MAGDGEAIPEAWKELVRSLGTEQLVGAIYVALDDFNARERDTIPPELWRRLGDRSAAYKNPFASDGGSSSGPGEVERIKVKLVAVGGEDGGGGGGTSSDSSEEAVVDLLRDLQAVPMTFETLEASKIGKTISGLRKHSSEKVRGLAAALYKSWKAIVDEHLSRSSSKPPTPTKIASAPAAADHAKKANTAAAASAPTKTAPALAAASAPKTAACNKRKEAPAPPEMDEAKLEAARKKLRERYTEEETAKKQRKIQIINSAPGKAKQRPAAVEQRRRVVVRDTGVAMASRAPVRSSLRM